MKTTTPITFLDLFDSELLKRLYDRFEKHINQNPLKENFPDIVRDEILCGLDWENCQKRFYNLTNTTYDLIDACCFLEMHCYWSWFARKSHHGHQFTYEEKLALVGYAFYHDNAEDGEDIESYINEQRSFASEPFIEYCFKTNLDAYTSGFRQFMQTNGGTI